MFRLTLKNLAANRIRLALTGFAVVLAVSFVVSSFVLTDGLRRSFTDLSTDIIGGTDFEIRQASPPPDQAALDQEALDQAALDQAALDQTALDQEALDGVLAVEGVDNAIGLVASETTLLPVKADGTTISVEGPPQIMFGWDDDSRLTSVSLDTGRPPGVGEFTIDVGSADRHGFEVDESYQFVTPEGREELQLVGLTSFGTDNATLGATLMHTDRAWLMDVLDQTNFDSILVAAEADTDRSLLEAKLVEVAPGFEVVNQATLASEAAADFNQVLDIFNYVLLGFAGVSLFVSTFIIANTFAIVLSQRTRELALLRTIGADPSQLTRSVVAEAAIVGALASLVGLAGGAGLALGLRQVFELVGADLPDAPTVITLRTVAVALAVGVGVTVLSAVVPAVKAARTPPMAALRDGAQAGSRPSVVRLALGAGMVTLGIAAGSFGLFVGGSTAAVLVPMVIGSIAVFLGVTLLSPLAVVPLTAALGFPLRRFAGTTGILAGQNAGRNKQRTASTAAALMIGLAVVSMTLVVGESMKAELRSTLTDSVRADFLALDTNEGFTPMPEEALERLDDLDETAVVSGFRSGEILVDGNPVDVQATSLALTAELFDLELVDGKPADSSVQHPLLVSSGEAETRGLAVGDEISLATSDGSNAVATVVGVFSNAVVVEDPFLLDSGTWSDLGLDPEIDWMGISLADGVSEDEAQAAFAPIVADVPQMNLTTGDGYLDDIEGQVDQLLTVVNAMVALSVLIALVGIANTMALSVFERTRELGLLRAVGMTRRQMRSMIRIESALVALFGAVLGVAVGILFGWGAVEALPAFITDTLSIPTQRIAVLVLVAGVAGLLAAWGPARRAGRLNVLDAISAP